MSNDNTAPSPITSLKKLVFLGLVTVFVVSVVLRMLVVDRHSTKPNPLPDTARSFAGRVADEHPRETGALETLLPYVTEASLFGLIGFALGYTSRKVFKLALLLIALVFVTVHVLAAMEKIEVDWSRIVHAVDGWILNLNFGATMPEFLKHRIPTLVAFGVGYLFGLKKG
jgi:uncharacterized membrane protein (Fun14 family)